MGAAKQRFGRKFWVERLEDRYFLSANPLLDIGTAAPPRPRLDSGSLAGGALIEVAPFPLEDTFFLHSLPGATKTIYLDFDGHLTRDTQWNDLAGLPNILTPAYSVDEDFTDVQ